MFYLTPVFWLVLVVFSYFNMLLSLYFIFHIFYSLQTDLETFKSNVSTFQLLRRIAGMVERCKETISSWECRRKWLIKEVATRSAQPPLMTHSESQRSHLGLRATALSTALRNPSTDLADTARQMG